MSPPDGVLACALADAHFHRLALRAHGVTVRASDGWWRAEGPGAASVAPYFMSAGTLAPSTSSALLLPEVAGARTVWQVRDCWATLDLSPAGFVAAPDDPWMVRPPASPRAAAAVPGLVVRRATSPRAVAEFERTVVLGSAGPQPADADRHREGDLYPAGVRPAADLHLLTGFLAGEPVATALAAVHPDVVMIGAVRTVQRARGRGIGTAMTAAALAVAPDRVAALGAREPAVPLYTRLGFRVCGRAVLWQRPR